MSRAVARDQAPPRSAATELAADGVDIRAGGGHASVGLVQAISVGLLAGFPAKAGRGLVGAVGRETVVQRLKSGTPLGRPSCRAVRGGSARRQTQPDPLTIQGGRRRITRRRAGGTRPSDRQAKRHPQEMNRRPEAHTNQDYPIPPAPLPPPQHRERPECRSPRSPPPAARRPEASNAPPQDHLQRQREGGLRPP